MSKTDHPFTVSRDCPNNANPWARAIRTSLVMWLVVFVIFWTVAPNYRWALDKGEVPYGADFLQEWVGARAILDGQAKNLYDLQDFHARQRDAQSLGFVWTSDRFFPPVYPPMHYAAFLPFALIPYRWAVLLWLGILIACAIIAAHQIERIIASSHRTSASPSLSSPALLRAWIWGGLLLFPAVLFSFTIGQKSMIWLVILTTSWQLLLRKRELSAGLVFGLLSIKPTLFFLLPLVLLSFGKIRFFVGASIAVAAIWGSAFLLLPMEAWEGFLNAVKGSANYPGQNGYRLDWSCNLLSLAYSVPLPFQAWFKQSVCAILAIYCLIACFERRSFDVLSPEKLLLVLCATFLLSPHTFYYDLSMLLLPVLWIYAQQPRAGFAYYAVLTFAVAATDAIQNTFGLPILPILLVGIVCELRLRSRIHPSQNSPVLFLPRVPQASTGNGLSD